MQRSQRLLRDVTNATGIAAMFPTTVEALTKLAENAKLDATDALERLYKQDDRSFKTSAVAADRAQAEFAIASGFIEVLKETSPDKAIREIAAEKSVELEAFSVDNFENNKKLYTVVRDVKAKGEELDKDSSYWLNETLAGFERRGMNLEEKQLARVVEINKEISKLSTDFATNISEDKSKIVVDSADELKGVPQPIIDGLKKPEGEGAKEGSLELGMDYPTYFGVMKNCEVAATREKMAQCFENRAYPANHDILAAILKLRQEQAELLGFESYAHFDLSSKMAKDPKVATKFIQDLKGPLQEKWKLEQAELFANLHPSIILQDGCIKNCDLAFAMSEYKKTKLSVSETTIQEYFPMEATVDALFKVYESFFDVKFEKVATDGSSRFWHEEVSTLSVTSNKTKELIGHVVMDLFPREGKFSHACCFGLVPAIRQPDGTMTPAVSVVLANFPKAQGDRPALFLYDDVKTFFHEFGHAIHGLMGRTEMATCSGTSVKRDFVELPSQMLEEWLWEPEILQLISKHYKTGEKLPKDLIDAKIASKNTFSGRDCLRQLTFASLSLGVHSKDFVASGNIDPEVLTLKYQSEMLPGVKFGDTNHFHCNFGHLTGYAATYYGYMWSEVFAIDVYEYIRSRNGLLDNKMGQRYIDYIIGRGGAEDPNELLKKFLEREPNPDAFMKRIGLTK